ncbi:hypothetical protein GCM10007304_49480 [Rhodococcoides trifolii]|uniref:Uncharacterized protein n=1 Tax=Rhodococcoides trifolii TaxID=908250 RepID=A0A917LJA7_9NOCA|nr:nucleotidyl transferase AbiEii/AbiGii toxin family protein [Rhodococcus trifolii]GGG29770.1 hypothetical protein GCM10007304_49480 [Rhodococcus trifolii]
MDSPPGMPATASIVGPTFAPDELAGRKLVALFDRAEARDFADVYTLTTHYDKKTLLSLAADVDTGFDHQILATMFDSLRRFTIDDIPVHTANVSDLRHFLATWATELWQNQAHS